MSDTIRDDVREAGERGRSTITTARGAERLAVDAIGLHDWGTTVVGPPSATNTAVGPHDPTMTVTATPCRHSPAGSRRIVGDVIGFPLSWDGQQHGALWISGDTVLYDGVLEIASRLEVGTAVVHLGCVRFPITGPVRYSMDVDDAIELCGHIRPNTVVPVHFDGWSHFSEGRSAVVERLSRTPSEIADRFRLPPLGTPIEIET